VPRSPSNVLRAVLFTDVVGSTELARELGDQRWAVCWRRSVGSSARSCVRTAGGRSTRPGTDSSPHPGMASDAKLDVIDEADEWLDDYGDRHLLLRATT
jgi:hypothetical protein